MYSISSDCNKNNQNKSHTKTRLYTKVFTIHRYTESMMIYTKRQHQHYVANSRVPQAKLFYRVFLYQLFHFILLNSPRNVQKILYFSYFHAVHIVCATESGFIVFTCINIKITFLVEIRVQ